MDHTAIAIGLVALVGLATPLTADEVLNARVRFGVPMSCAALARIHAAEYPEAVRICREGHSPRSVGEANRALLGLQWRHRLSFAQTLAIAAFSEWAGRVPTDSELRDAQSRWVQNLMSYPPALRKAIAANCAQVFVLADRSRPTRPFDWSP